VQLVIMALMFIYIFVTSCLIFASKVRRTTAVEEAMTGQCTRGLDVVFLVDASSDIIDTDWKSSLDVITQVSSELNTSLYGTHVGVLLFAANTSTIQALSHQLLALNNQSKTAQRGRNLAAAIVDTRSFAFNNKAGDRPDVPDVLVIITHRVSDDPQLSFVAAEQLKSDGIRIIAIGTKEADQLEQELRAIATYPRQTDKLTTVYEHYHSTIPARLREEICGSGFDAAEGSARLADESAASGMLEMFVSGEWISVCSTSWTHTNTDVACRELGFPAGLSKYTMNEVMYSAPRRTMLVNATCVGNESRIVDCPHDRFFIVDFGCDRQRHVFLRCLCDHCNDYHAKDNLRLADGSSTYGRLEVFSPKHRWGGVCDNGWSDNNTRVICRELGFLDGTGTYDSDDAAIPTIPMVLDTVTCDGNENSLFDCSFHTMSTNDNCSLAVNVMCQCSACLERNLIQSPRETKTMTGSSVQFEWKMNNSTGGDFEFWFLSRKNRRLVLRKAGELITAENTELQKRVALIGDNETTVGFRLTNASRADMGVYALHVPRMKLFNSQAILFLTDFAVVPDAEVRRQVGDRVELSWDLTALRQLRDISHEILLTTPATGRLPFNYYYTQWLRDNPLRHSVQPTDQLHPTIVIDYVTANDAGNYVVEVMLKSAVHQWLNSRWQFATLLVVDDAEHTTSQSVTVIVLATLLAIMSLIVCGVLVRAACRRCRTTDFDYEQRAVAVGQLSSRYRSRQHKTEDAGDFTYNSTEAYQDTVSVELPTYDNDQQKVSESDDGTIDIHIREEPPADPPATRPSTSRSESTQLRRIRFANSSRRAK